MSMPAVETATAPTMRSYFAATSAFAAGRDTPRAFLERCLAATDAWEPKILAYVNLNIEGARKAADAATERWKAGHTLSPLDGMPIGIKDIIETRDMPTENGSPLYKGARTERDAASVAALRQAGAVIVGKTVTTEFAATSPGPTRNPWDLSRTPGGSSSGSAAAVAAGMLPAALGTQVIGSTIRPASYCGVFGFKPSVGALNRSGSHDGLSQSSTGLIAASLEECWQVAHTIVSLAGGDLGYRGLEGPAVVKPAKPRRIALIETGAWPAATEAAKSALAAAVARIKGSGVEVVSRRDNAKIAALETSIEKANPLSRAINEWELRWPLNTYRDRDASKLSKAMLARLANAEAMTIGDYRGNIAERARARAEYAELAAELDGCITLSAPGAAPHGIDHTGDPGFTVHTSYLGIPTVTLPVLEDEGLPLGLQVIGFEGRDGDAMACAMALNALFELAPRGARRNG